MMKYIAYPWPEYQEYMGEEWFREECYYCADKDVYFIPINRVNESENKEIRKDIISNLKRYVNCIKDGYDASSAKDFVVKEIEKQIAWLEKQDKNNKPLYIRFGDIPKDEKSKVYNGEIEIGTEKGVSVYPAFEDLEGNIVLGLSLPITKTSLYTQQHLLEYDNRACYLVSGDYVGKGTDGEPLLRNIKIIREIKDFRVKQDEQETLCDKCRKEHPSHSCQDITELGRCSVEHEQETDNSYCQENCKGFQETGKCFADGDCKAKREAETIDKFKPEFKVGDWVVFDNGNVEHITSVGTHGYTFDDGDYLLHDECDKIAHLWSIQDAKDGDVLVSRSPFIYGKQCPYGGLNWCNNKFIKASNFIFTDSPVHPATKEQRDLLFQKMKEAGYIFDFKNKELKKIKNDIEIPFGAKDSELQEATYYIPKGFHAEIDDDKVVIKKGEKLTAWSEEDERIKKLLIHLIKTVYDNTNYLTYGAYKGLIAWLEKLDDNVEL